MYDGLCYPNGSYFASDHLRSNILKCGSNRTANTSGEVVLPNGNTCNDTSEPIQCSSDGDGFVLTRDDSISYSTDALGYKCCLPHDDGIDIIIANIYGKTK